MSAVLITAISVVLAATISGLFSWLINRKLNKATTKKVLVEVDSAEVEAAKQSVEASLMLLGPLKARVMELERKLDEVLQDLDRALRDVEECHAQRDRDEVRHTEEKQEATLERDAVRARLCILEEELDRYKAGPNASRDY